MSEQRERLAIGTATRRDLGSPAGDQVDGGEVLEDLHGIRGRQHSDRAREPDARGCLRDRGEHDGRRRDGEVGAVVLTHAEDVEPRLVSEHGEIDELA